MQAVCENKTRKIPIFVRRFGYSQMFKFLVKLPRYKTFDYTPIYYDEAKEDLQERVERAQSGGSKRTPLLRGSLKDSWSKNSIRPQAVNKGSSIRIVSIAAILTFIIWYLLK